MLSRYVWVGYDKNYDCQWHPYFNNERIQHLQSTWRWARKRSSDSRALSNHMAPEDTGAWDSASLEMAGLWSLGVLSGLWTEIFLTLIKRDIFLANRYRQWYVTAYAESLTTVVHLWDKCQLQGKPLLSSGNSFLWSSSWMKDRSLLAGHEAMVWKLLVRRSDVT